MNRQEYLKNLRMRTAEKYVGQLSQLQEMNGFNNTKIGNFINNEARIEIQQRIFSKTTSKARSDTFRYYKKQFGKEIGTDGSLFWYSSDFRDYLKENGIKGNKSFKKLGTDRQSTLLINYWKAMYPKDSPSIQELLSWVEENRSTEPRYSDKELGIKTKKFVAFIGLKGKRSKEKQTKRINQLVARFGHEKGTDLGNVDLKRLKQKYKKEEVEEILDYVKGLN